LRLVIFDLDGTLLTGDTDEYWLRFLIEKRVVDHGAIEAKNDDIQARYARGEASAEEFCFFYLSLLSGHSRADLDRWHDEFMSAVVLPNLPAAALELLERERAQADLLVLSTATNGYIAGPIAKHLGFEHMIATDPEERADGTFTGGCVGLPNMRANKVVRLDEWLRGRGTALGDFSESRFFSDSRNDLPLLERVTHPVVVDPDAGLAEHARRAGWPILHVHPLRHPELVPQATCAAPRNASGTLAAPQA
jgi:HAD superfamily hydrolase (TIGR01490 family)